MKTEIILKYNANSSISGEDFDVQSRSAQFLKTYLDRRGYGPKEIKELKCFGESGKVESVRYTVSGDPEVLDGLMDWHIGEKKELSGVKIDHLF